MKGIVNELRFAVRALLKQKASSAGAILILAIAIGSNTAIFGVVQSLILRPLPVRNSDRLVVPQGLQKDTGFNGSVRDLQAWRRAQSFEAVAAAEVRQVNLTGVEEAERVDAAAVESGYLGVFGISPIIGRFFSEEETLGVDAKYVVLGHGLWRRRFGGDGAILGKTIMLDGQAYSVLGVLPAGFDMPFRTSLWLPSSPDNLPLARQGAHLLPTIARLRRGVSIRQANAELQAIARRLESDYPDSHSGWSARILDLRAAVFADPEGRIERGLVFLFAGGAALLLIACANFGNLLLARSLFRSQEIGTLLALGAGRGSIARQFLFEGLLLAFAAAALSFPVSFAAISVFLKNNPVQANAFSETVSAVTLDGPLVLFSFCLVLLTGTLAAAVSAIRASRLDAARLISGAGRSTGGRVTQRLFALTVVSQIALTLTLLIASRLFVESFGKLKQLELGFAPHGLIAMDMSVARKYPIHAQRLALVERLLDGTRSLPGVESAGVTTNTPLTVNSWASRYECEGKPFNPSEVLMTSDRMVTAGYLETLGVRLLKGRLISQEDTADAMKVAVINAELAARCWPGEDPVGRRIRRISQTLSMDWIVVAGLIEDVRENRLNFRGSEPVWYVPYSQWNSARDLRIAVRTRNGVGIAGPMRELMRSIDPTQPLSPPADIEREVADVLATERIGSVVLTYFSSASILLASIGIYAALAGYVVRQRRAIGMRIAVGAQPSDILRLVVSKGLALTSWGTSAGILISVLVSRLMSSVVFGVAPTPWRGVPIAAAALFFLTAVACIVPARRALRIDPIESLRQQ